jgi:hypothetical protein
LTTDKGEAGGSSPPRPTIQSSYGQVVFPSVDLILNSAEVHVLSDRPEDAIADLKKGLQEGLTTTSIETDPELDSLRKRPDYQALMTQSAAKKP